ncbi:hypothetical protein LSH36_242g07030 [Paralvinella palmiformis]|uniref:Uncharacterized protein n=1 Tax=Paralvinella palmiformis TaxID=53620 RepID=A0AAD9JMC9_9ANNE|nr:hypothetical protein LSH36_242g07030 [Paralvinella palmiformis]
MVRHESYANLSMCMNRAHPGQEKDRKDSGSKSAGSQSLLFVISLFTFGLPVNRII